MAHELTNLQFRISTADKNKFAAILEDIGLDVPTAFRMFVKKVINTGGIPFKAQKLTENGMTVAEEQEILAIIKEAQERPESVSAPLHNAEEVIKYLQQL